MPIFYHSIGPEEEWRQDHRTEECGARRPDKTSLIQHKISHLQSANGPTIILVTKPSQAKTIQGCIDFTPKNYFNFISI